MVPSMLNSERRKKKPAAARRANLKIIVTGGAISSDSFAQTGSSGIAAVGDMFYDKALIGVDGIHPDHGLTTNCPDRSSVVSITIEGIGTLEKPVE